MDTIAIDPAPSLIHNPTPDRNPAAWSNGLWCETTLGIGIHVRVGWDGLINRAYDAADEERSGHWQAES